MHPGDEKQPPYPVFTPVEGGEMSGLQRGSVAVVGAAESDLGQVAPDTSPLDLMAQATMRALDDCGLAAHRRRRTVRRGDPSAHGADGARGISRASSRSISTARIIGGSSFMTHVAHAQAAIEHRSVRSRGDRATAARSARYRAPQASPREYNLLRDRPIGRSCRSAPTRWPRRATCISTARRASSLPKLRSRRANGR